VKKLLAEYSALGYLEAKVEPIPTFNDLAQTADFVVNIAQGPQYRMGALRLEGFSDAAADKIRHRWALHEGAVFAGSYPADFVAAMGGSASYTDFDIVRHPDSATADVVLRLVQAARP
jgi:outer membrane protein assembly factor BamA